ncbi:MAG: hypothetical protein NC342_06125 [Pseudoflavonifractor sp.]|nr:hypothetical protein [Alloprevotella sp.]MCM1117094.1 hypothetical protein [Pseudoflavonifractor sp.]
MNKFFIKGLILPILAIALVSCSDDDDPKPVNPDLPEVSAGAFILNQGNLRNKIEGSLTYIDYTTSTASQRLYQNANGVSLGNTPQCAAIYGSKMYVGVYESNVITIVDKASMKAIKQISLADNEGQSPRSIVTRDGKVYFSMYNGYVTRLDTVSLAIDGNLKVGPNPEIMALVGNDLYVPNSDGMNYKVGYGTTASVVDLASFSVKKTLTVGLNPCKFVSNGTDLFLLAKGNYGDVPSKIYQVSTSTGESTVIAEASLLAIRDKKVYMADAPWGTLGDKVSYSVYDITSKTLSKMTFDSYVDAPVEIAVDPLSNNLIVTSYVLDGGKAATSLPGYACQYSLDGKLLHKYDAGVGPAYIFFNLQ